MADTYTVAVRIPVAFESAAEMAGFLSVAVTEAMKAKDWIGEPLLIWRQPDGTLYGFHEGGVEVPQECPL